MSGAPIRVPRFFSRRRSDGGWSFVELVMIIGIAAVLAAVTVMRFRPLDEQAYQQADGLRNDLRHMQMLAITWGQPTVVGGRVFVASSTGQVYALDATSGCTIWTFEAGSPVRDGVIGNT